MITRRFLNWTEKSTRQRVFCRLIIPLISPDRRSSPLHACRVLLIYARALKANRTWKRTAVWPQFIVAPRMDGRGRSSIEKCPRKLFQGGSFCSASYNFNPSRLFAARKTFSRFVRYKTEMRRSWSSLFAFRFASTSLFDEVMSREDRGWRRSSSTTMSFVVART